jgi:hypothetical protein
MEWQDIIVTPLFWIVSVSGTLILSIVGNLLTPYVAAFVTRNLQTRRTGLREKQRKRRAQVIRLEENIHRRISTKLDAVFKLLVAMVALLGCLFLFQLTFGPQRTSAIPGLWPSPNVEIPTFLIIMMTLLFILFLLKSGSNDMSLAFTADRRERARNDFLAEHGPTSDIRQFEDEWDLKTFGVKSQDDQPPPSSNRA